METPWKAPLPTEENKLIKVLVYFHDGKWVPTVCCTVEDAIKIYQKALIAGREYFVFPVDTDLSELQALLKADIRITDSYLDTPISSTDGVKDGMTQTAIDFANDVQSI